MKSKVIYRVAGIYNDRKEKIYHVSNNGVNEVILKLTEHESQSFIDWKNGKNPGASGLAYYKIREANEISDKYHAPVKIIDNNENILFIKFYRGEKNEEII